MTLLRHGANTKALDARNNSALDLAVQREGDMDEQRARVIRELIDMNVQTKGELGKIRAEIAGVLGTMKEGVKKEAKKEKLHLPL